MAKSNWTLGSSRFYKIGDLTLKHSSSSSGFLGGAAGKSPPASEADSGDPASIPGWKDPLGEALATHARLLAGRTPRTEEPGGRQSRGSHRAGHGCTHLHDTAAFRGKQDGAGDESSV